VNRDDDRSDRRWLVLLTRMPAEPEIYNAEDKAHATTAAKPFVAEFGVKWPKAAAKISDDLDVLLAFYDFPAEHWIHLRTTNPSPPSPPSASDSEPPRAPAPAPRVWRWPSS
jgi:hypothetical protein